ncbi:MAG: ABC transporter ATP-binding protein [Bacilli bacterium]|nr:ABC transporter ATP-binding protein [Bacilli bacterium]
MNNRGHGPSGSKNEKVKDFKGTIKKLFSYMSFYKVGLILILIFALGSTVFSIVGPKILGNATTELYTGLVSKINGGNGIDFDKIKSILIIALILYVVSALFSYIQGFIMTNISQKITYKLRKELSEKIGRLPISFFDKKTHGEILSIITNDIDTMSQSLNQSATQIITSVATIIGILVMMLSINVSMTLITVIVLPISMVLIGFIMKKSQKHFVNQQKYLSYVNGNIEEMYSGHSIIKVFNAENKMLNEFNKNNDLLYETAWKSQFLSGLMQPIMVFIGNINYVLVAIFGGYFAVKGKITVGNIQSFIQYSRQFTNPIAQIAQVSNMLQSMMAASERVFEFLEQEEENIIIENPVKLDKIEGNVEFKNVKFGYDSNKIIINDFSAKIKSGQKIAIVGPTGAGKTTMIKLLMRFYNTNSGAILIDNKNINDFNREDLRNIFGMVLQDTWLFTGTIMDNLRYGNLSATDDQVIEAAKNAHVHHFIQTLPDGYNMELNEETNNISGGQKQLLTIARAILADPKVLILDEATSNVDTRTEILIQKAMDKLMEGRTTFIIAHRLSTIKNADMIIVMNEGDIVEMGNHNELLNKQGLYANLYNSQFENI